jgi:hypothetical protein
MEGNNEKCYSAIPCCDHSFPCFEWLWAKSISHCHPRGAHTDIGTAHANASAAYIDAGIAHANTGAPNTHSDTSND